MYLVAISPDMLPTTGDYGQISLKLTCEGSRKKLQSFKPDNVHGTRKVRERKIKIQASNWLLQNCVNVPTDVEQLV